MKNPSSTKAGPGRVHYQGHKRPKRRKPAVGFGALWLGQHTNPLRRPRDLPVPTLAKPLKVRKHKQHKHTLRDAHGAYTLTGTDYRGGGFQRSRRIWLAGISAQRGF